ncbi:hypothetical protein IFM89_019165 [Coptis chinensis]|uniref:RNase H type-1 domain-containing protein n=1 Tax=Coptis chinensis TaxID=261450 RepID=A0A835GX33_9MAGN|nr:hypothetical protein IFM89_019165 [Coptis chinensis]
MKSKRISHIFSNKNQHNPPKSKSNKKNSPPIAHYKKKYVSQSQKGKDTPPSIERIVRGKSNARGRVKDTTDSIVTREFMHRIDGSVTASSCGYGGVLRNREGAVLGAYTGSSLNRSVTFQELLAVEKGLECALLMNFQKVRVATDLYRAMQIIQNIEYYILTSPVHRWLLIITISP